jgi:anti-anti-sigma factor
MFDCKLAENGEVMMEGRLDASQAPKAEAILDEVTGDCIINCTDLDYVSSAGIGVILATYKRLYDTGNSLKLTNANPQITKVFHYAGLAKLFGME